MITASESAGKLADEQKEVMVKRASEYEDLLRAFLLKDYGTVFEDAKFDYTLRAAQTGVFTLEPSRVYFKDGLYTGLLIKPYWKTVVFGDPTWNGYAKNMLFYKLLIERPQAGFFNHAKVQNIQHEVTPEEVMEILDQAVKSRKADSVVQRFDGACAAHFVTSVPAKKITKLAFISASLKAVTSLQQKLSAARAKNL